MTLFEHNIRKELLSDSPLSSRMRPKNYDEFVGQNHILGKGKILRNLIAVSYTHLTLPTNREV